MRRTRAWRRGTSCKRIAGKIVLGAIAIFAVFGILSGSGVLQALNGVPASLEGHPPSFWDYWTLHGPSSRFRFSMTVASRALQPNDPAALEERRRSIAFAGWDLLNAEPEARPKSSISDFIVDPACRPFQRPLKNVAVVGNGPLSRQQRVEISKKDLVIRFNFLNNMWRDSERIDIWAVRYSFDAKHRFWGFGQLPLDEALSVLNMTQSMWLIGGENWAAYELVEEVPEVARHMPVLIPQEAFLNNDITDMPSTGFIGLKMVLGCTQPSTKVHTYGMNWSPKIWEGHKPQVEADFVRKLQGSGRLKVHKTPCPNMRTCDGVDLDSDCHFDLQRNFVCPKVIEGVADGSLEDREFVTANEILKNAYKTKSTYLGNLAADRKVVRRKRPNT